MKSKKLEKKIFRAGIKADLTIRHNGTFQNSMVYDCGGDLQYSIHNDYDEALKQYLKNVEFIMAEEKRNQNQYKEIK